MPTCRRPRKRPLRPSASGPPSGGRARARAAGGGSPGALTLAAAFHLLKDTLATLGGLDEEIEADRVRDAMAEQADSGRDPLFEGSRFQRLLRQAHDANLIELSKTDDGHYMLKLNPGALVEDRDEREGAGGAAEEEAEGAGGAEGVGENSASGKRRRGRRGGRGRGKGRGQRDDAEVSEEPAPAAEHVAEARPERVTSGAADAESAATSRHRNPRFRHGSRGLARPAAEGPASPAASESAAAAPPPPEPPSPPAATPAFETGARARSLRPRSGSRGVHRGPVSTPEPSFSGAAPPRIEPEEATPAPVAAPAPRHETMRAARASAHHDDGESPPAEDQPSLLKRVTAALQRAVRGPEGDKPSDP